MDAAEAGNKIIFITKQIVPRILKALAIEGEKSIRRNFEAGGRPKWIPRKRISKKQRGTNILVISGSLKNVVSKINSGDNSVSLITNPRARAYARIQQEGGTIDMPARNIRFRKSKGRIVFASHRHKNIHHETMGRAYQIKIPARPYLIIPPEDYPGIVKVLQAAVRV